jgi:putative ubiquitin-RnfH superfamily antitoxin RatB of RatAB toxin-antitoxin module
VGEREESVDVVYALPDRQRLVTVSMPATGLTAQAAVEQSGLLDEFPELRGQPLVLGVYGTVCAGDRRLCDRDRVEIYRPLRVDPRAQRRERAAARPAGRKRSPQR